jgi:hypothetical protein
MVIALHREETGVLVMELSEDVLQLCSRAKGRGR